MEELQCIGFSECCLYTTILSSGRGQVFEFSKGFSEILFRHAFACVGSRTRKIEYWNFPKSCLLPIFRIICGKHCWIFKWQGSWCMQWWDSVLHQLWCHLILRSPRIHGYAWRGFLPFAGYPMPCACYQSSFQGPHPWYFHTRERYYQEYLTMLCYKNRPCHC